MERTGVKAWREGKRLGRGAVFALAALVCAGCAGGMPSIPDTPEDIVAKGDQYFKRGKYYPSQELFKAFLTRYSGHERSDYAQYMLAESYFHMEEYALASVEYRVLVTNYGYSEYVDEGYYREAVCNYLQSPKAQLDQTKAYEALSQFEQFVRVFSASPSVPEAEKYIAEIHEKLAGKELENAEFYYRKRWYASALIYLDKIIAEYPGNTYWIEAKFMKAKILYARGERFDEAAALLREVIEYPGKLRIQKDAEILLGKLEKG
jgi:outer membrane protein assembly factor BamD